MARLAVVTAFKTEGADAVSKEAKKLARDYRRLSEQIDPTVKANNRFARAQKILDEQLRRGKITLSQYQAQLRKAKTAFLDTASGARVFGDRLQSIGGKLSSAGRGLTVGLTLPILAVGAASLHAAVEAVEAENLFEVSFGNMATAARTWSEELGKALGLNRVELRRTAGVIFTMVESMGIGEQAAFDMATGVTELAGDLASFFNISTDEAFRRLRSGLVGEQEPLRRLGILVDAATVKATAYRLGIARLGTELTQQQKVMARWAAIQEQTTKAQGDLARTIKSPANQLRVLRAQAEEAAIAFGQSLIPMLQEVLPILKGMVDRFNEMTPETRELVIRIGLLAAALGPVLMIVGRLTSATGSLVKVFGDIIASEGRLAMALKSPWVAGLAAATAFYLFVDAQIDRWKARLDAQTAAMVNDLASLQALVADLRRASDTGELPMATRVAAAERLAAIRREALRIEAELARVRQSFAGRTGEVRARKRIASLETELQVLRNEENTLSALVDRTSELLDLSGQVPPPFGGPEKLRHTKDALKEMLDQLGEYRERLEKLQEAQRLNTLLISAGVEQWDLYHLAIENGLDPLRDLDELTIGVLQNVRRTNELLEDRKRLMADLTAAEMAAFEATVGARIGSTAAGPGQSILPDGFEEDALDAGLAAGEMFGEGMDDALQRFQAQQWRERWRQLSDFAVDVMADAMYQIVQAVIGGTDDIQAVFEDTFRQLGGQLGSAAVAAAGGGPLAQLGGQIGGEILGAEIGKLLGGLFGSSDPVAFARIVVQDGRVTSFFERYASGLASQMNELTDRIADGIKSIFDDLGGELVGLGDFAIQLEGDDTFIAWLNGIKTYFDSAEAAVEAVILEAVKSAEAIGLAPEIIETLRTSTADSLEELQRELANAVAVRDIDLSPLQLELRNFVEGRLELFDDALSQGITTAGNVLVRTVADLNDRVRQFRGIELDPVEQIREQGQALQQQQRLFQAELLARRATIEAMIAEGRARIAVTQSTIDGTRALLTAGMETGEAFGRMARNWGAVGLAMGGTSEALEAALASLDEAIAALDVLSDQDIGDAVRRARRDEQRRRAEERQTIRDEVGAMGLSDFALQLRAIHAIVPDLTERMRGLGFSAEETAHLLALATEEQQRQIQALHAQLETDAGGVLARAYDFLGRSAEAERLRFEIARAMLLVDIERLRIAEQELGLNLPVLRELEGLVPMITDMSYRVWRAARGVADELRSVRLGVGDGSPIPTPRFPTPTPVPTGQTDRERELQRLQDLERSTLPNIVQDILRVNDQFDEMRRVLGNTARVQRAYNAVLRETLERYIRPIADLQRSLVVSNDNFSPLKLRERLDISLADFGGIQARIAAGDLTVLEDVPDAAREVLELARQFFPTGSAGFQVIFDLVNQVLTSAQELAGNATVPGPGGLDLPSGSPPLQVDFSGLRSAITSASDAQIVELRGMRREQEHSNDLLGRMLQELSGGHIKAA